MNKRLLNMTEEQKQELRQELEKEMFESNDEIITDKNLIRELRSYTVSIVDQVFKLGFDLQCFTISADGLRGSYGKHVWSSATDSSISLYPRIPKFDQSVPFGIKDPKVDALWIKSVNDLILILEKYNKNKVDCFSIESYLVLDKIWSRRTEFNIKDGNRKILYSFLYDDNQDPLMYGM